MVQYDVVIVGAGPAGLSCALNLKDSGLKILLIDKKSNPGSKICAGGMRHKDIERLSIPEDLVVFQNNCLGTVSRKDFFNFLIKKIKSSGITYLPESKLTAISEDSIIINTSKTIRFKYLVGADGSNSKTRKLLGLKNGYSLYSIQYHLSNYKTDKILMDYAPLLFNSWYAWTFPHKNYVAVGCCAHKDYVTPAVLKKNFLIWTKKMGIDISGTKPESYPINCDFQGYRFKNVFLIGDAAGLADEYTGEGIHQALVSGEEIAKMILDPHHPNTRLKQIIGCKLKQRMKIIKLNKTNTF